MENKMKNNNNSSNSLVFGRWLQTKMPSCAAWGKTSTVVLDKRFLTKTWPIFRFSSVQSAEFRRCRGSGETDRSSRPTSSTSAGLPTTASWTAPPSPDSPTSWRTISRSRRPWPWTWNEWEIRTETSRTESESSGFLDATYYETYLSLPPRSSSPQLYFSRNKVVEAEP